ncbi:MAG TPA: MBL fold metallo-hydrolase [Ramlibacter sp.]|uniref:MBL fold metallo-hydrolase n=1 Tax=Ramlibacter sp. TaxID=1917967 RepID=UPI002D3B6222|nr:MBL fold metallo-hydrolase [Ramlibacter sp.]HZY19952.1 MBL fold metallo-hydrolase [Ramlibacter sp.]
MTLRGGAWRPVEFPARPTLLVHPEEGPVLFDTGYADAFTEATRPVPERFYRWLTPMRLPPGLDAASQCRSLGIEPAEVRHVVLSHFHADHVAGLNDFPAARIHCARAGLADATRGGRWRSVCAGVLRGLLPADIASRARFFEERPRVALPSDARPFTEGADVLGDGSLLAVELPGHCPGHWGLLVADARRGLNFLVADATWSVEAVRTNTPPPALTTGFLGSTRRYRATLGALHVLHVRNPDLVLTPYHGADDVPARPAGAVA